MKVKKKKGIVGLCNSCAMANYNVAYLINFGGEIDLLLCLKCAEELKDKLK